MYIKTKMYHQLQTNKNNNINILKYFYVAI